MAVSAGAALLSTLGTGAGVALGVSTFIGGSFLTHFLVSTAIGAAINALTPKPTTPGAAGYTVTARGANLDHQIIYGQTRVAGAVVADFLSGDGGTEGTRHLHRVQVMAGHEIESYEEIYVNSYKVTEWKANTAAGPGAVTGITDLTPWYNDPFAVLVPTKLVEVAPDGTETEITDIDYSEYNALTMQFWTGADDQTASTKLIANIPNSKWTSDHRLRGRAYMYIRMGRDADGDNFPTGVPEITAVIKGRKVYDPREVSHDPDDKSTWEWSDNPALCIRDYLTQDFGLGEKDIQVDDDLVETAANVCDQTADDGSTRYTCNGAFTTGLQPYDLLNSILTSMGGLLWYAQGQWRMKPAYWTAPTESFNEDDFRSAINVSTRHSRKDNFNVVEGTFRGPASNYALTTFPQVTNVSSTGTSVNAGSFVVDDVYIINTLGTTDWNAAAGTTGVTYAAGDSFKAATTGSGTGTAFSTFNSYLQTDGGIESKIDLELPFTDTPNEARRISRIVLERNRQQLTVRASFGLKALRVQVGDVINLSLARFGWENKTFEVTEWSFGNVDQYDIQIELTLREISENVFDEIDDGAAFELDNGSVPSPLAGLAVTNLTATPSGFLTNDGTFIGNILVEWDAIVNSNVREYIVEWGRAAFNFDDYGGEVTSLGGSPTARETFIFNGYNSILGRNPDQEGFDYYNTGGGSSLTQAQFEAQLANSPEARAISGSARVDGGTTEYTIASAVDDSMYSIRVKAINDFGTSSAWATVTVNTGKDGTVPSAPTSLIATGSYRSVSLKWTAPTANTDATTLDDLAYYVIYRGTSANPTTEHARTASNTFVDTKDILDDTTYHYRVKAFDFSGNGSAYSGSVSATTAPYDANAIKLDAETGGSVYFDQDGDGNLTLTDRGIDPVKLGSLSLSSFGEVNGVTLNAPLDRVIVPVSAGLADGDQVVFTKIIGEVGSNAGLQTGEPYYLANETLSGQFQLSTTYPVSSGSIVNITQSDFAELSRTRLTKLIGVHINTAYWPDQFRAYQNSSTEYAAYFENLSTSGGTVQVRSQGGFTAQFLTSTAGSGYAAIDAQNTATGGGKAQICLSSSDGGYAYNSVTGGYYDLGGDGYLPFTGKHDGMILKTASYEFGDILVDSRVIVKKVSDVFTELAVSSVANDASAVGVVSEVRDWYLPASFIDKEATRLAQSQVDYSAVNPETPIVTLHDAAQYHDDYDLVHINSVGEGSINVCGQGGNITKGDLIVTSSIPGKGMKQADDIVRSYTVAKAREDVTFSSPTDVKMVPCIYLCG